MLNSTTPLGEGECPSGDGSPSGAVVVADDLSGACECAGVLLEWGIAPVVRMNAPAVRFSSQAVGIEIIDADLRRRPRARPRELEHEALRFVKLDSLLRGPVGETVSFLRACGRPVVFCNANPALGRTVELGVTLVNGVPLADTDLWHIEQGPVPERIDELLASQGGTRACIVPMDRSPGGLLASIRDATAAGNVACVDARYPADLDLIVAAAPRDAVLVGAGGLFAAWARAQSTPEVSEPVVHVPRSAGVLVVVGSASSAAREQVDAAAAEDPELEVLELHPDDLLARAPRPQPLACGSRVIVRIASTAHPDPAGLSRALGQLAADVLAGSDASAVLVGGETARNTLDALGVTELQTVATHSYGSVVCRAPDGRSVTVRPGSFGSVTAVSDLIRAVQRR